MGDDKVLNRDQALVNELVVQRNDAQNKLADALADLTMARVDLAVAHARVTDLEALRDRLVTLEAQLNELEAKPSADSATSQQ